MNDELKSFQQESWQEQHKVSIHQDAKVSIDDIEASTPREIALANIILRLNGSVIEWTRQFQMVKDTLKKKEENVVKLRVLMEEFIELAPHFEKEYELASKIGKAMVNAENP